MSNRGPGCLQLKRDPLGSAPFVFTKEASSMQTTLRVALLSSSLLLAAACQNSTDPRLSCLEPAPLLGQANPMAPGYIVVFHPGVDPEIGRASCRERV